MPSSSSRLGPSAGSSLRVMSCAQSLLLGRYRFFTPAWRRRLLLVIYAALSTGIPGAALTALIILVIAALGGFYLASIHLRGQIAPKAVVFVHAGIAATAT